MAMAPSPRSLDGVKSLYACCIDIWPDSLPVFPCVTSWQVKVVVQAA